MMIPVDLGGLLCSLFQQLDHLQRTLPRIAPFVSYKAPPSLPFDSPHVLRVSSNTCLICQNAWYGSIGVTLRSLFQTCPFQAAEQQDDELRADLCG